MTLEISNCGPPLTAGPLPGFFYFALSGKESLHLDPYNQPVTALAGHPIRCYSATLPFHGEELSNEQAMEMWGQELAQGAPTLLAFLDQVCEAIDLLIEKGWLLPDKIAVGGLSRGGWIATQLAARYPGIKAVVGFAPLTRLSQLVPGKSSFDLHELSDKLTAIPLRFYMGNRDLRVSTDACYQFIRKLADAGYAAGHRSPHAELILTPSIGHKGHGTPKESFYGGARWILKQLKIE